MGRGRPKKNKDAGSTAVEEREEIILEDDLKNVLVCNSKQTFGMIFKRNYVELYERNYFEKDTTVKTGDRVTEYKAGDFGPWKLSSRPYPANWERALTYVADWVAQDNLTEKEDFNCIIEVISESKTEVINSLKTSIDGYMTKVISQSK